MHYDDDVGQYCVHRNYLPDAVLALSSACTLIVALLVLNSYFCCTPATTHYQVRRQASRHERLLVLVHYALALPLFELVVVWGSRYAQLAPNGASVVVSWICVQLLLMILLSASFWTQRVHVFALHMSQVMQVPAMVLFIADRALYHELGVECVFCLLVLALACAEAVLRAKPVGSFESSLGEARLLSYPGGSFIDRLLQPTDNAPDFGGNDMRLDLDGTNYVAASEALSPRATARLRANTALHGGGSLRKHARRSATYEPSPRTDDDVESEVGSVVAGELKATADNRQDLQFLNNVAHLDLDLPPDELKATLRTVSEQAQARYAEMVRRAALRAPGHTTIYLQSSNSASFVAPTDDDDDETYDDDDNTVDDDASAPWRKHQRRRSHNIAEESF